jgi:prevent-host-death family protein
MQITAAQLAKQSLALLERIQATHEEILITQEGKPVARLVPIQDAAVSCLDLMRDGIGYIEDGPSDLSTNPHYLENYGA